MIYLTKNKGVYRVPRKEEQMDRYPQEAERRMEAGVEWKKLRNIIIMQHILLSFPSSADESHLK